MTRRQAVEPDPDQVAVRFTVALLAVAALRRVFHVG
jgi:hypothetical protein